jgi:hypothetical protein
MSATAIAPLPLMAPIVRRIRAYFAPVNRTAGVPAIFDPAQNGSFNLDSPPSPWLDLGWLDTFQRNTESKVTPLRSGAPGLPLSQVRTEIDSIISINFSSWGKLQMAATAGSEQMNLLATTVNAPANGSGGTAAAAVPLSAGSTASFLGVASNQLAGFSPGQMIVVDIDYSGQTGYVGSGISGAYVSSAGAVNSDVNYIRRISFNVARVISVTSTGLQLAQPLIAGSPIAGMSMQTIVGFVDREGSNFFQEWSGLFVIPGEQGDRVVFHYPRLQISTGAAEAVKMLTAPLEKTNTLGRVMQTAQFRGLPVTDSNDGAQVVCFRSYIPAPATNLW